MRDNFLYELKFTEGEYIVYWNHFRELRNQGLAHFDFHKVYELKPNNLYFDKIPVQCVSIAKSVVYTFEEEYKLFPQRQCSITAQPHPVLLSDIVKHLKEEWRVYPID